MADYPIDVIRCPVHGIPDCSPMLNGCTIPSRLAQAYDAGKAADASAASAASQGVVSGIVRELEAVLADDTHVVRFGATEFGLRHGFPCRTGGLLECPVGDALNALDGPPVSEGYYIAYLDAENGSLRIGAVVEPTYDPVHDRMTALLERLTHGT